jgi:gas vesicle protein
VLESQKAALAAVTAAPSEGPSQRSTVSTTRNRWVQTANAILSNAKLLRKDDAKRFAPVVTEFETALAKVEARAARRRAAARADADPDATEEPAEKAAPKVTEEPLDKTG